MVGCLAIMSSTPPLGYYSTNHQTRYTNNTLDDSTTTPIVSSLDTNGSLTYPPSSSSSATLPSTSYFSTPWSIYHNVHMPHQYPQDNKPRVDTHYAQLSPTTQTTWGSGSYFETPPQVHRPLDGQWTSRPPMTHMPSSDMGMVYSPYAAVSPTSSTPIDARPPFDSTGSYSAYTHATPISVPELVEPSSLSSAHAHLQTPHWDDSMLYVSPSAQPAQLPVSPVSNYPSPPSAGFVIPPKLEHAKKVPLEVETSSVYPANSASLDERQKAEVDAYLARQDTKERPPSHMIERARKETDWKAIRHMNPAHEVVEELLRMTTKNQKNSTDAPKRPMNAFMIYMSIRRPAIAKINPRNVNGENSRVLAREWTWFMPDSEKQYWLDLADDYREEFKRRFPSFQYRRTSSTPSTSGAGSKRRFSEPGEDDLRNAKRPAGPSRAYTSNPIAGDRPGVQIHGWSDESGSSTPSVGGFRLGETPSVLLAPKFSEGYLPPLEVPKGGPKGPGWATYPKSSTE